MLRIKIDLRNSNYGTEMPCPEFNFHSMHPSVPLFFSACLLQNISWAVESSPDDPLIIVSTIFKSNISLQTRSFFGLIRVSSFKDQFYSSSTLTFSLWKSFYPFEDSHVTVVCAHKVSGWFKRKRNMTNRLSFEWQHLLICRFYINLGNIVPIGGGYC